MKKRLCFLLCMALCAAVCNAHVVTEPTAQKIAKSFFTSNPQTKASAASLKLLWDGLEMGPSTKSFSMTPPFYVYGLDGEDGFVIVAGDDICRPVLGYSYAQSFDPDNIPDGLRDWFEMVRSMVNGGSKKKISASAAVSKEWKTVAGTETSWYTEIKKLETALWDQGKPYNWKTPILNEERGHTFTGCVNTASAIVMKYWEYPEAGTGRLDDYYYYDIDDYIRRFQAGHDLGHKYEWDKMLMEYTSGYTTEQGNAVATLMYDLAVMNTSSWGYSGTGSTVHNKQYIEHMGYDKDLITGHIYDFTSISQWCSYLKKEIDEGRPVLYCGFTEIEGHQFVLDGYATNDYFSVNWGWGGSSNGYFVIDPSRENEALIQFISAQEAVLGMKPEDEIDDPVDFPFSILSPSSTNLAHAIRNNQSTFNFECFAYQGRQDPIKKKLRLALMRDSKVVKYLTEDIECTIQEDNGHSVRLTRLTANTFTDFSRGDYICIGYVDKDGNWVTCGGEYGMIKLEKETSMMNIKSLDELMNLTIEGANSIRLDNSSNYMACIDICRGSELLASIPPARLMYLDTYFWGGSDLTVTIYDLFESYEMTIKLK